ncbi:MAG: pitrilysin family protein [Myxococcota bacterium]
MRAAALLLLVGCATAAPSVTSLSWRRNGPSAGEPAVYRGPAVAARTLKNGLTVAVVESDRLPLTALHVVVQVGSADDPSGYEGTAAALGELLCPGAVVDVSADAMTFSITVDGQPSEALAELARCIQTPELTALDAAKERLQRRLDAATAEQELFAAIYPDHPYRHPIAGSADGLARLSPEGLALHHRTHFSPDRTAVILAGPVRISEATEWIQRLWNGNWGEPRAALAAAPEPEGQLLFRANPKLGRTLVFAAAAGLPRAHPDALALLLGSAIVGRQLAVATDAIDLRAGFEFRRGPGPFRIQAIAETTGSAKVIRQIVRVLDDATVSTDELDRARADFRNRLPAQMQTQEATVGLLGALFAAGLPLDYFASLPENLAKLDAEDIQRVVRRHLDSERLFFFVVGDPSIEAAVQSAIARGG